MTESLRVGILSTAKINDAILTGARESAGAEVVAVASRDRDRAAAYAQEKGIPRSHGSYEELLADEAVEAVYIPLPNGMHLPWSERALAAGKHVLCEKPLALTARDAEEMIEACDREGVRLMEAFMYRVHPSWVAAREIVASGRIGRLQAVQSWFSYYNDDPTNIRNILDAGGGALYDIGCYCVNLSRMLFGGEPTRVQGTTVRDATGTDVISAGILSFGEGIASFVCSTRAEDDQRVEIYGTTGRISIGIPFNIPPDLPTRIAIVSGGDPPVSPIVETMEFAAADPYTLEADLFAAAVLEDAPLPVAIGDAVANLRVMEAILDAGTRG